MRKLGNKRSRKVSIKTNKLFGQISNNLKGLPLGIIIGIVIVAAISAYAAPKFLDSKIITTQPSSSHPALQSNSTSNKQLATNSETSHPNQPSNLPATSTNSSTSPANKSSATVIAPTTITSPVSIKTPATLTGIEVITPDPGANQDIYIPQCDFIPIISGTPETCYHYKPIQFNLVAMYSDGSTSQLSWAEATVSAPNPSGGYPFIPTLLQIDQTNNLLDEGTGIGYFCGLNGCGTVTMNITYRQWTYTKYIHIYVSSMWGNP